MASAPLLECTFLIPLRRDQNLADGKTHRRQAWSWLANELMQFGGATRSLELYEGWYVDPDTAEQVTDLSRKYTVAVKRADLRRQRAFLREACGVFYQKCIYLSVAGHVEFVKGPGDETS